jgi:hypothetical protein
MRVKSASDVTVYNTKRLLASYHCSAIKEDKSNVTNDSLYEELERILHKFADFTLKRFHIKYSKYASLYRQWEQLAA